MYVWIRNHFWYVKIVLFRIAVWKKAPPLIKRRGTKQRLRVLAKLVGAWKSSVGWQKGLLQSQVVYQTYETRMPTKEALSVRTGRMSFRGAPDGST